VGHDGRHNRLGRRRHRRASRRLQRRCRGSLQRRCRDRGLRRLGRYRLVLRCRCARRVHRRARPLLRRLLQPPRVVVRTDVRRYLERPADAAARSERRDPDCVLRHCESLRAIHVPAGFRRSSRDRGARAYKTVTRLSTLPASRGQAPLFASACSTYVHRSATGTLGTSMSRYLHLRYHSRVMRSTDSACSNVWSRSASFV
jgi:hypothetical protein